MFDENKIEEEQAAIAAEEDNDEAKIAMQCVRHGLASVEIKPEIKDVFFLCTSTRRYKVGDSFGMIISNKGERGKILHSDGETIGITIKLHSNDTCDDIEAKISEFEQIANRAEGSHLYLLNAYGTVLMDYGTYFDDMDLFGKIINMSDYALCDRLAAVQPSDNEHEISMLKHEALRRMFGDQVVDYYTGMSFSVVATSKL